MLPDWMKDDDEIYRRHKDLKNISDNVQTGIDDIRRIYYDYLNGNNYIRSYTIYHREHCLNMPAGLENDNNLKPISIVIANWERYYYIPFVIEMYHSQNYPKNLIEIIIVDADSRDKDILLNTIKEQVGLYPDIRIRFIQDHINKKHNPAKRRNIGMRHASHNIIIVNESDTIPLGRNFLRGICYAHNRFEKVSCIGIGIGFKNLGYRDNILDVFNAYNEIMPRLDHDYVISFDKGLVHYIHGFDEHTMGYGGLEGNISSRYALAGGRHFLNTSIYSAILPNFPKPLPPGTFTDYREEHWQNGIVINDNNWGISENMREINLY